MCMLCFGLLSCVYIEYMIEYDYDNTYIIVIYIPNKYIHIYIYILYISNKT